MKLTDNDGNRVPLGPSTRFIGTDLTRLPRRGSYIGQSLKFMFTIVMVGFLLAVLIQFGYWLVTHLQQIRNYQP